MKALAERMGKQCSVAEDFPAFIVNRILLPMINEAVYALQEGVGGITDIDTAMRLGANHPMGPLELADFIGLDTCLSVMQVLHQGMGDSKYRPCPLLVKYVEAGWLGAEDGQGLLRLQQQAAAAYAVGAASLRQYTRIVGWNWLRAWAGIPNVGWISEAQSTSVARRRLRRYPRAAAVLTYGIRSLVGGLRWWIALRLSTLRSLTERWLDCGMPKGIPP